MRPYAFFAALALIAFGAISGLLAEGWEEEVDALWITVVGIGLLAIGTSKDGKQKG